MAKFSNGEKAGFEDGKPFQGCSSKTTTPKTIVEA
jgi:hypothetical protein